jgi:hypothetical protein
MNLSDNFEIGLDAIAIYTPGDRCSTEIECIPTAKEALADNIPWILKMLILYGISEVDSSIMVFVQGLNDRREALSESINLFPEEIDGIALPISMWWNRSYDNV